MVTRVLVGCLLVLTQQIPLLKGENIVKVERGIFGEVQEDQVGKENIPKNESNLKLFPEAKHLQIIKPEYFNRSVVTTESPEQVNAVKFDPKIRTDGYQKLGPEDSPYVVFLWSTFQPSQSYVVCSGSLLTEEWVLTAAHCMHSIEDPEDRVSVTWIVAGASNTSAGNPHVQRIRAEKLVPFPLYDRRNGPFPSNDPRNSVLSHNFDIMLVKAEDKFYLTKHVDTIELSFSPWYKGSKECVVVGFGRVFSVKVHKDDFTRKTHRMKVNNPCICGWVFDPYDNFVCPEPKEDYGVCKGDSGSGLVCDGKIQGVFIGWWKNNPLRLCQKETEVNCGSEKISSGYLKTCPFLSWISEHVDDDVYKSQIPTCSSFLYNESLIQCSSVFVMVLFLILVILL